MERAVDHDWPREDTAQTQRLGRVEFMGLGLQVGPGVLVPRAETELLGYRALDVLRDLACAEPRVIDLCCGAGNLAIAIAHHVPLARVWAGDLTTPCVEMARVNVRNHGLEDRVTVAQGDLFEALSGLGLEGSADVVVCNPPYISSKRLEGDRAFLLEREPRDAFDGGPYGLTIHQRVIREVPRFLRPGGMVMLELGEGQDRQLDILFRRSGAFSEVRFMTDESGMRRVVEGRTVATGVVDRIAHNGAD
jgi:release factor glutamine methyltransferase